MMHFPSDKQFYIDIDNWTVQLPYDREKHVFVRLHYYKLYLYNKLQI